MVEEDQLVVILVVVEDQLVVILVVVEDQAVVVGADNNNDFLLI